MALILRYGVLSFKNLTAVKVLTKKCEKKKDFSKDWRIMLLVDAYNHKIIYIFQS